MNGLISKSITIQGAADLAGLTDTAIRAAIARGELKTTQTHCRRATLLSLADVRGWMRQTRKRGPKAKVRMMQRRRERNLGGKP